MTILQPFFISVLAIGALTVARFNQENIIDMSGGVFTKIKSTLIVIAVISGFTYVMMTKPDPETGMSPNFDAGTYITILVPVITGLLFGLNDKDEPRKP